LEIGADAFIAALVDKGLKDAFNYLSMYYAMMWKIYFRFSAIKL